MIDKEAFDKMSFETHGILEPEKDNSSFRITGKFERHQTSKDELMSVIVNELYDRKSQIKKNKEVILEVDCDISYNTYKKYMSQKGNPDRLFIAKFCIGLKLSLEKANKLFMMHSGELNDTNDFDCIVKDALKCKDDIYTFEDEVEELLGISVMRKQDTSKH